MADDRLSPLAEAAQEELEAHARRSGLFDTVNTHEPKSAPGTGLTAAIWCQDIRPVAARSGLNVTSARLLFQTRIYTSMLADPQDAIDLTMIRAAAHLVAEYGGDFEITTEHNGQTLKAWVDIFGHAGQPLVTQAGYLNQDGKLMRVMDTVVPFITDDVWDQEA